MLHGMVYWLNTRTTLPFLQGTTDNIFFSYMVSGMTCIVMCC